MLLDIIHQSVYKLKLNTDSRLAANKIPRFATVLLLGRLYTSNGKFTRDAFCRLMKEWGREVSMNRLALLFLLLSLFACTPTIAQFRARCQEIGFAPDTPEIRDCILRQDIAHKLAQSNAANEVLVRPYRYRYGY